MNMLYLRCDKCLQILNDPWLSWTFIKSIFIFSKFTMSTLDFAHFPFTIWKLILKCFLLNRAISLHLFCNIWFQNSSGAENAAQTIVVLCFTRLGSFFIWFVWFLGLEMGWVEKSTDKIRSNLQTSCKFHLFHQLHIRKFANFLNLLTQFLFLKSRQRSK